MMNSAGIACLFPFPCTRIRWAASLAGLVPASPVRDDAGEGASGLEHRLAADERGGDPRRVEVPPLSKPGRACYNWQVGADAASEVE
jgi:hypothetical protein